jgi:AcrR family transcriptional regulator
MATKKSASASPGRPEPKRRKGSAAAAPEAGRRAYRSDRRDRQAAQTRRDVLQAAVRLFGARGWAGTTMAAVAEEAGVAVETVYSGFRSKKALLRQAIDVAVVGDDEPVPLADRPEYQRMADGRTEEERMRTGIALLAAIQARTAPLWSALVEAAAGDEEVAGWFREIEEGRRSEIVYSLQLVLRRPLDDRTVDLVWALYSAEVYGKLVFERGWDDAAYQAELLRVSTLLAGDVPPEA